MMMKRFLTPILLAVTACFCLISQAAEQAEYIIETRIVRAPSVLNSLKNSSFDQLAGKAVKAAMKSQDQNEPVDEMLVEKLAAHLKNIEAENGKKNGANQPKRVADVIEHLNEALLRDQKIQLTPEQSKQLQHLKKISRKNKLNYDWEIVDGAFVLKVDSQGNAQKSGLRIDPKQKIIELSMAKGIIQIGRVKLDLRGPEPLWNGKMTPPAELDIDVINCPEIKVVKNQRAIVKAISKIQFFEKSADGTFTLNNVALNQCPGIILKAIIKADQAGDELALGIDVKLNILKQRKPIPGVDMDVGKPVIESMKLKRNLKLPPDTWVISSGYSVTEAASLECNDIFIINKVSPVKK